MNQLVKYEAMRSAIAICHSVDEIKDLHDKALALELYTRQAHDRDAERKAADIRLRAERRAGELLKDLARGQPGRPEIAARVAGIKSASPTPPTGSTAISVVASHMRLESPQQVSPYRAALTQSKIPERTAQRWQDLAKIPEKDFEAALADPASMPTTTKLIQQIRDPVPHINDSSLTLWGIAWGFEREKHFNIDIPAAVAGMTPEMRKHIRPLMPRIVAFLTAFAKEIRHEHA